ncbi:hypothetical protein ACJMK2_006164 [Sinanodonta woodiana]|uniref:Uncharacterized protein n=1 Tax=Sinanodonta woodiana TaxID=1069815 RepID=A0ABD3VSC9_SINWO
MRSRSRRSTRWYEAARRNGHYVTPARGSDVCPCHGETISLRSPFLSDSQILPTKSDVLRTSIILSQ